MCGDVIYASWLVLYGLCAAIPPLVANENFVTTLLILFFDELLALAFDWFVAPGVPLATALFALAALPGSCCVLSF